MAIGSQFGGRWQPWLIASAIAGVAGITALVAWYGLASIAAALLAISWRGLLLLAALHLVLMMLCGFAWRLVLPPGSAPSTAGVTGARILRDAGTELLPISPVGGALMGMRALAILGVPASAALASTVVDVTLELMGQLGFTALGIAVLLRGGWAPQLGLPAIIGLGIGAAAGFGFLLAQRVGLFLLLQRLTQRITAEMTQELAPAASVHDAIRAIYRRRARTLFALTIHFVVWCMTAIEAWLMLRLIGAPLPLAAVLVMESLTSALKSAAFFVPSGLGVQEGGYVFLGALLGLGPETALALSLAKRARELTVGLPALLLWQTIEARRFGRLPLRNT